MESIEHKIMQAIWDDICGRSGGDHFLEDCDEDIQQEIKEKWMEIIRSNMNTAS